MSEVWLNTVLNPSMRNHEEMNLEDWAYLQYKLNCYSYVRVTNENKEQYLDLTEAKGFPDLTLQKDLHGELTFAIPLFGLLLSGSLDMTPQKQRVISGKSSNRVKAKNRKSDDLEYEAGLNKCSLNLSPDLIAAQTSREHETNDNSVSDGKRKSPTLHFVRGHTFVRNGKISYRSPHGEVVFLNPLPSLRLKHNLITHSVTLVPHWRSNSVHQFIEVIMITLNCL